MLLAFYFLMIELIYIVLSGSPWERYRELLQKQHTGTVVLISLVFGVCLYLHQFLLPTLLLTLTPTIYYFYALTYNKVGHPFGLSIQWTWNLGEILVDVIYSRRTTTNKRETTLHATRSNRESCVGFISLTFL